MHFIKGDIHVGFCELFILCRVATELTHFNCWPIDINNTTLKKNYGTHVIKLDIAPVAFPLGQHLFISASNNMFYRHSQWDKRHTICVVNLMPQDTKIEFLNRSCLGSNLQSSGWVIFISAKAKFTISVHWLILKDENATQYGIYGTGNESYLEMNHIWKWIIFGNNEKMRHIGSESMVAPALLTEHDIRWRVRIKPGYFKEVVSSCSNLVAF